MEHVQDLSRLRKSEENRDEYACKSLQNVSECRTTYDIFKVLKNITLEAGYNRFIVFKLPEKVDAGLGDITIVTNWDPEMIKAYDSMALITASPVMKKLSESILPFHWHINKVNKGRDDQKSQDVQELFTSFGMYNGVYISLADRHGTRAALGLAGDRDYPTEQELRELVYISNHVYEKLGQIESEPARAPTNLTPRECECIKWTAAGKTSGETATILNISENTVNHYLTSAALKLDTVNKAHTVAKAIRMGILD